MKDFGPVRAGGRACRWPLRAVRGIQGGVVTAGHAAPMSGRDGPGPATLRRLYVVEQWSMADLQGRYRVRSPTVRRWLLAAGIEIRRPGSGGYRRQLAPPAGTGRTRPRAADVRDREEVGSQCRHGAAVVRRGRPHTAVRVVEEPAQGFPLRIGISPARVAVTFEHPNQTL